MWKGLFGLVVIALAACAATPPEPPPQAGWQDVDQGPDWRPADRAAFYTQDQGSEIIPASWIAALRQPDGQPFLADRLARYGYLANTADPAATLPVGFMLAGPPGRQVLGMNCAACHTREIQAAGRAWRIDGAPALADFERFLTDLRAAVAAVQADAAGFDGFATAVLGPAAADPAARATLRAELDLWWRRYDTIIGRSLPRPGMWGAGRLDAVSMIFNRVTGLDIGTGPDRIIASNVLPADVPVRYPFLWNSWRQDLTQWPGFAENGTELLALARNLGQVYGVFATFHPVRSPLVPVFGMDYVTRNSANIAGLRRLETLVERIGAPRSPFVERNARTDALAAEGEAIFNRPGDRGGCAECHAEARGAFRSPSRPTWLTTLRDVGTDSREISLLGRMADSGVMAGAGIAGTGRLQPRDRAAAILRLAVVGSIAQHPAAADVQELPVGRLVQLPGEVAGRAASAAQRLRETQQRGAAAPGASPMAAAYESRVLYGIWAAAPYLHNGSVPTLADLLEPAEARPARFTVGTAYDPVRVGLAAVQPDPRGEIVTTGCEDRASGNSRCGHEYGTRVLTAPEKAALLEYLRRL